MKFLLSILSLFVIALSHSQNDKRLNKVEQDLEKILKATKTPGFAVAVVEGDKIIYAKGFGYRDYENKIEADANTLYAIGSSTKAFTSGLLGLLEKEGKLSLDDNPRQHLPSLEFSTPELNNNVIIKDLMSHRTGLPRHDVSWYLFPTQSNDTLIQRIKYQEPFTGLREQWYYNNFMFLVQGSIAEAITGKSWGENIKESFFEPLGMSRSNVSIDELENSTNAALGYELNKDEELRKMDYYRISSMRPAGSINSSVNEMAKWLITWINKGKYGEKEILPENYVQAAISSHSVVGPGLPSEDNPDIYFANYGYGWFLSSYKGHYRVEHGGNIDGFSANAAFYPTDKIGIVVLSNQNGSPVPSLVRNTISDRMLNEERRDWAEYYMEQKKKGEKAEEDTKSEDSSRIENTTPSHPLVGYTGKYSNPGYGEFNITLRRDSLFAKLNLKTLYLQHHHYDVFEPMEVTSEGIEKIEEIPLMFNFRTNIAGDISSVYIKAEPALDELEFKRTPPSIKIEESELAQYTGEYDLGGMKIKIYTKGNVLYAFVPGQPEYELIATEKHKFSFKALEGFKLEFVESSNGKVNEVKVIQPNGTFTAKR